MATRPSGQRTWVEVSRAALLRNLRFFKGLVHPAQTMCVVKANAYGHGMALVSQVCGTEADWFGVDTFDEASTLRLQKIHQPILVMGYVLPEQIMQAVEERISWVVYTVDMIKQAAAAAKRVGKPAHVHLKLETGLTRQGLPLSDLPGVIKVLKGCGTHLIVEGISTHYANVEDRASLSYADAQLDQFEAGAAYLAAAGCNPRFKHTAATAAAMLMPSSRQDLVRLGISLYGLWPSESTQASFLQQMPGESLFPALTWKTVVIQVKHVPKGTPVGYGLTERVSRDSVIAVLPIGYWDGYDRTGMSRKAEVLIREKRCKVLGRICMNMCMVDATDVPGIRQEDEVVILGSQKGERVSAEELAHHADTIHYELVTRINPVIPRMLVR